MQMHKFCKTFVCALLMSWGLVLGVSGKAVTTSSFNIAPGETREWHVYMTTVNSNLVSFQMDITLPDGLTLNVDQCGLTSRVLDKDQELFMGLIEKGHYRLVTTSFSFVPLTLPNATLLKLSVTADKDFKGGECKLHDMIMVNSSANSGFWGDEVFDVTSVPAKKGDVDFNEAVDVADTMLLVDYTINGGLYSSQMDVNGDGDVNVSDVMEGVKLILEK